jgi:hypothetical protein
MKTRGEWVWVQELARVAEGRVAACGRKRGKERSARNCNRRERWVIRATRSSLRASQVRKYDRLLRQREQIRPE